MCFLGLKRDEPNVDTLRAMRIFATMGDQVMRKSWAMLIVAGVAGIFAVGNMTAVAQSAGESQTKATSLTFGGKAYVHRWSKNGQNEYTQPSEPDLERWRDMVTINVNESVRDGEQLAAMANSILANYEKHGTIVRSGSKAASPEHPAEHLIVALLGTASLSEAAFARVMLIEGVGVVAVYSHRIYGKDSAAPMGEWLQTNGPTTEKTLLRWENIPSPAALKQLPQSR